MSREPRPRKATEPSDPAGARPGRTRCRRARRTASGQGILPALHGRTRSTPRSGHGSRSSSSTGRKGWRYAPAKPRRSGKHCNGCATTTLGGRRRHERHRDPARRRRQRTARPAHLAAERRRQQPHRRRRAGAGAGAGAGRVRRPRLRRGSPGPDAVAAPAVGQLPGPAARRLGHHRRHFYDVGSGRADLSMRGRGSTHEQFNLPVPREAASRTCSPRPPDPTGASSR